MPQSPTDFARAAGKNGSVYLHVQIRHSSRRIFMISLQNQHFYLGLNAHNS